MNLDNIKEDKSKIATANEEQLKKIIGKYSHLAEKQGSSIKNLELALEASKNKQATFKEVVFAANIAMMQFNTVQLFDISGNSIKIDIENHDDFIKDGYIDSKSKVFILKKSKLSSKITDMLTIEEYQAVYGKTLHKPYEPKLVGGKNLYAVIGEEEEVKSLLVELAKQSVS
jgi:hypothetical protein